MCVCVCVCGPDDDSALQLPTALHFAAKYGLSELASYLLDLPDSRFAFSIANCDGQYPEDLARAGPNRSLATYLENFREVVSRILLFILFLLFAVRNDASSYMQDWTPIVSATCPVARSNNKVHDGRQLTP